MADCEENLSPLTEPWNTQMCKCQTCAAKRQKNEGLMDRLLYLSWRSALMSTYTVVGSGPEVPCSQSQYRYSEHVTKDLYFYPIIYIVCNCTSLCGGTDSWDKDDYQSIFSIRVFSGSWLNCWKIHSEMRCSVYYLKCSDTCNKTIPFQHFRWWFVPKTAFVMCPGLSLDHRVTIQ